MARYCDSVCRLCRREGMKLFLKGDRCIGDKCSFDKRSYPPGQHGSARTRGKVSEYGVQLREKQKTRRVYGIFEKQFRHYYALAAKKKGVTGENLLRLLEQRLDNVVYRLSFVDSRRQGRQMVGHGHFNVNGKRVNIPSYLVGQGDVVSWKQSNGSTPEFVTVLTDGLPKRPVPTWLNLDVANLTGEVTGMPDMSEVDTGVDSRLIVEFYSK